MYRILHADAPPHGRQVVHLPDVRLGARPVRTPSRASPTRSARWSSRTTARCTTGSCDAARHLPPAADRVRPAEPHLHGDEQAQAARSWCKEGIVRGWDDPRMPTLAGLRRRGYTPEAIRDFCERIGVAKTRQHGRRGPAGALRPRGPEQARAARHGACCGRCKVVIDNYPEGQVEELDAVNNPEDPAAGTRKVPFSRVLYIEQDDFREEPPPKYFRLAPGPRGAAALRLLRQVRGRGQGRRPARSSSCAAPTTRPRAAATRPTAARSRPRSTGSRRRTRCRPRCGSTTTCSARPNPDDVPEGEDFTANLNPNSLEVLADCCVEPSAGRRRARRPLPVRAAGLLLRRPRFRAGQAGLQPHGHAAGHVGEDRGEGTVVYDRVSGVQATRWAVTPILCHPWMGSKRGSGEQLDRPPESVEVRSRPRTTIVWKRGGATVLPVTATLERPEELTPVFRPSSVASGRSRLSRAVSSSSPEPGDPLARSLERRRVCSRSIPFWTSSAGS